MINRDKMIETFEEIYGLPADTLEQEMWERWLAIWAVSWKYAEEATLQTIAAEREIDNG